MVIQSITCTLPWNAHAEKEQTKCSFISRIIAVALGSIALIVGVITLIGLPGLNAYNIAGGGFLIGIGVLLLLVSASLKCISRKPNNFPFSTSSTPQSHQKMASNRKLSAYENNAKIQGVEGEKEGSSHIRTEKSPTSCPAPSSSENVTRISTQEVVFFKALMRDYFDLLMDTIEKSTYSLGKAYLLTGTVASESDYLKLKTAIENKLNKIIQDIDDINYLEEGKQFLKALEEIRIRFEAIEGACSSSQVAAIFAAMNNVDDFHFSRSPSIKPIHC